MKTKINVKQNTQLQWLEVFSKEWVYGAIEHQVLGMKSEPPAAPLGGKGNMCFILELKGLFNTSIRGKKDVRYFERIYIGYR